MSIYQTIACFSLLLIFFFCTPHRTEATYKACLTDFNISFKKAKALKDQHQYLLAAQQYSLIEALSCDETQEANATFGYAQSLYLLGEKNMAHLALAPLLETQLDPSNRNRNIKSEIVAKTKLLRAWYDPSYRTQLPENYSRQFEMYDQKKSELEESLQIKNAWLAGSLSAILPGLGQVYNENYQSGAMSFVINALFLAAALELHQKNLEASSIAAGLIFSITYTGNIFGSVESAKQINHAHQAPALDQLRSKEIPDLEL